MLLRIYNTALKSGLVTIELTRKHAVLFAVLTATQTLGLWLTFNRSPDFAGLCMGLWSLLFLSAPGSAFLTTIIVIELVRAVFAKD